MKMIAIVSLLLLSGCSYSKGFICDSTGCERYENGISSKSSTSSGYTPWAPGRFNWVPGHPDCYKYGRCTEENAQK
jgi:hypothetical protein